MIFTKKCLFIHCKKSQYSTGWLALFFSNALTSLIDTLCLLGFFYWTSIYYISTGTIIILFLGFDCIVAFCIYSKCYVFPTISPIAPLEFPLPKFISFFPLVRIVFVLAFHFFLTWEKAWNGSVTVAVWGLKAHWDIACDVQVHTCTN